VVGHGDGFHKAFGLIIDPTGTYGAYIPEIVLTLWVYQRISIDLGGGGHQDSCLVVLGQTQEVHGSQGTHLKGLYGNLQIIDGACRGGKVEDIVHPSRNMDKGGDVVMVELKAFQVEEVFYVPKVSRDQVVHPYDVVAFGNETVAKVGTQKSCCSCDEGFFHNS